MKFKKGDKVRMSKLAIEYNLRTRKEIKENIIPEGIVSSDTKEPSLTVQVIKNGNKCPCSYHKNFWDIVND